MVGSGQALQAEARGDSAEGAGGLRLQTWGSLKSEALKAFKWPLGRVGGDFKPLQAEGWGGWVVTSGHFRPLQEVAEVETLKPGGL